MKKAFSRKNLWDSVPPRLKRFARWPLAVLPRSLVVGPTYRKTLAFLRESERWESKAILAFQQETLKRVLSFADANSSYYRRHFSRHKLDLSSGHWLAMFKSLPTTGKSEINAHLHEIVTSNINNKSIDLVTTGGTSGTPLRFYSSSNRSAIEFAYLVSNWGRVGYRLGDTLAVLRGKIVQENSQGFHYEFDPLLNHHYFSSFHLNDGSIGAYLQTIRALGRCFLHVYPSTAVSLARFIRRRKIPAPTNIQAILCESEILYEDQRTLLVEVFGCKVFSSYGHTEKLVSAAACEASSDYHVWPTYGYFELLDELGNEVTVPGQRGEIVGTSFISNTTPFIRYRTGDFATFVSDACELCGRNHKVLRDIRGHRIQENLVARDRSLIPWAAMNMHDDTFDNVTQFQFQQTRPGHAIVKLVTSDAFNSNDLARIEERLSQKLAERINCELREVDAIPLSKSGKSIYVDQKIDLPD